MGDEKRDGRGPGDSASELHRRSLVVDLHTDSLLAARLLRLDLARRHRPPDGFAPWRLHADVPRLREGGVDAVFLGVVTHPWTRGAFERAARRVGFALRLIRENRGSLALARNPGEVLEARRSGRLAVGIAVEGLHMLSGRLENIERLYGMGVSCMTLAHFTSNRFAASSAGPGRRAPLSQAGREAVREMNRLGILVDLSHSHRDQVMEVCSASRAPVIVSHGGAAAVRPFFRNLTDTEIRAVAATGGVIGIIFAAGHLAPPGRDPDIGAIVDHADHVRKLVGVDHVALGSDWDGLIALPRGMRDAAGLPALTRLFLDRGYPPGEVEKILGLNFMRVFEEVAGRGRAGTGRGC